MQQLDATSQIQPDATSQRFPDAAAQMQQPRCSSPDAAAQMQQPRCSSPEAAAQMFPALQSAVTHFATDQRGRQRARQGGGGGGKAYADRRAFDSGQK